MGRGGGEVGGVGWGGRRRGGGGGGCTRRSGGGGRRAQRRRARPHLARVDVCHDADVAVALKGHLAVGAGWEGVGGGEGGWGGGVGRGEGGAWGAPRRVGRAAARGATVRTRRRPRIGGSARARARPPASLPAAATTLRAAALAALRPGPAAISARDCGAGRGADRVAPSPGAGAAGARRGCSRRALNSPHWRQSAERAPQPARAPGALRGRRRAMVPGPCAPGPATSARGWR